MNLQETFKATGDVYIKVYDRDGKLKEAHAFKNRVVTTGKYYIANRLAGVSTGTIPVMGWMSIGTGTGTPADGDTNLGIHSYRAALDSLTATTTSNTVTATATFAAGNGTGAITEAGIFNYSTYTASPSSTQMMLCRTTFPAVNKAAGDQIAITWQITIS